MTGLIREQRARGRFEPVDLQIAGEMVDQKGV
jgi:hypothetical protein